MLKQRVITALVLLAILLPAVLASNPWAFNAIVLIILVAAAWEWGRLSGLHASGAYATGGIMLLVCVLTWYTGWLTMHHSMLWLVAGGVWVLGSSALLKTGVGAWSKIALPIRWTGGMLALWIAGCAMVQARAIGINFLFSLLALVWVADVFAYFFGRAFGQRLIKQKLAPSISPGKSWEGALGGAIGVVLLAFFMVLTDAFFEMQTSSLYTRLYGNGVWLLLLAALFLAVMSVVGDLVESLIKRSAGIKDSSHLFPGHGGVLDRIDALLPVLPLAMMLNSWVQ